MDGAWCSPCRRCGAKLIRIAPKKWRPIEVALGAQLPSRPAVRTCAGCPAAPAFLIAAGDTGGSTGDRFTRQSSDR